MGGIHKERKNDISWNRSSIKAAIILSKFIFFHYPDISIKENFNLIMKTMSRSERIK